VKRTRVEFDLLAALARRRGASETRQRLAGTGGSATGWVRGREVDGPDMPRAPVRQGVQLEHAPPEPPVFV
jgi:hypothetical protein